MRNTGNNVVAEVGSRVRVYSCATPETFKYFIDPLSVEDTWKSLEAAFAQIKIVEGFGLIQIDASPFVLRAPRCGNPITVIRKRGYRESDINRLHSILAFDTQDTDTDERKSHA